MISKKVNITNKSIEKANRIKDFNSAISEYIWNGFDAKATKVNIEYTINPMSGVDTLEVIDDGTGIDFEEIDSTFGILLDSKKVL